MIESGVLGLLVVLAVGAVCLGLILHAHVSPDVKALLAAGLILHLAGSQLYYYMSQWIYGFGDYSTYYQEGTAWGSAWLNHTLSTFQSPYLISWCCTGFLIRLTGSLMLFLGPNINAEFLAFALFGYVGIVSFAVAFARAYPTVPLERYLWWIILFPSLWYWSAALGKDTLIVGGTGIAVMGYVGRRGRSNWLELLVGIGIVFVVRPQVAAVIAAAMVLGHWLGSDAGWTMPRMVQGIVLLGGAVLLTLVAGNELGVQMSSPQEVGAYLSARSSTTAYGGSAVHAGVISGIINVTMRPFPWDVHGVSSGIAALEVLALWITVFVKRHDVAAFYRAHRYNRLLWFAIVFTPMFVVLSGMALGNLGLIARQRVLIFPFLFMFLAGRSPVRQQSHAVRESSDDGGFDRLPRVGDAHFDLPY